MADIYDRIQQAIDETSSQPNKPYPSMASVAVNHPGFMTHQVLTDAEYQQKVKHAALIERLAKIQQEDRAAFDDAVVYHRPAYGSTIKQPMMVPVKGRYMDLKTPDTSPYRARPILAPGMFIRNAADAISAAPSVVVNTARSLWDLDKAAEQSGGVANKATFGAWNIAQGKEPNEAWAQERDIAQSIPFNHPLMFETRGNPMAAISPPEDNELVEGPQVLKDDFKWADNWKTDLVGYGGEAVIDPIGGASAALRHFGKAARAAAPAARAIHGLRGAALVGQEAAYPAVWVGLGEAARRRGEE
jgi:hypothetical protein